MGQFLTAVFELRPTRRKAAALERVRAPAEAVFWEVMATLRPSFESLPLPGEDKESKKLAKTARIEACRNAQKLALQKATKAGLVEPVAAGLARDVEMAVSSFAELRAKGQEASWPVKHEPTESDYVAALQALAASTDQESESKARDELARVRKPPKARGLTLARSRDGNIIRDQMGRLAAVLNCLWANDKRSRQATINPGVDPSTGEGFKKNRSSKTKLVIPLACSKWHENKFLAPRRDGRRPTLRSSIIFPRDDRWWMAAQFEMPQEKAHLSGAVLGVDRGCVYPVAAALVDANGALIELPEPVGKEVGEIIVEMEQRRREESRRRGITSQSYFNAVNDNLHRIANSIVDLAREHGAVVAVEKLGEFKRTIVTKRIRGSRKGGWRRVLKKAQLGKLEMILKYKLELAGLPQMVEVVAAGSSQSCAACGHRAKKNRADRDAFKCVECGHEMHADSNAAIIVARRGVFVLQRKLRKGDTLDQLHKNMIAGLRAGGMTGLGRHGFSVPVVSGRGSAE